jgi:hypothetical protein
MIQTASLSRRVLNDASELVQEFVLSKLNADGGFQDRCGLSDIYYTVFGLECLKSLKVPLPKEQVQKYLDSFGFGEKLDLVHLTSLIRCLANLEVDFSSRRSGFLEQLERYRSADGGFNTERNLQEGTGYAAFLVYGSMQDLSVDNYDRQLLRNSIKNLRVGNGSYGMLKGQTDGATPTTAAATVALFDMGERDFKETEKWLINNFCLTKGGFYAIPNAPMPDLLSTATALHTLSILGTDLKPFKNSCLDFVDSLWTSKGSFYGTWADDILDVEYTMYALLALGHLAD